MVLSGFTLFAYVYIKEYLRVYKVHVEMLQKRDKQNDISNICVLVQSC